MGKDRQPRNGQRGARDGGGKKRTKPEDESALWQAFTQDISPLNLKGRVPDTEASLLDEMLRQEGAKTGRSPTPVASGGPKSDKALRTTRGLQGPALPKSVPPPNIIDAKEVRRIGKGRSGIDARIDLHGMRQNEAHAALRVFLFRAVAKGHRMVLVITGKGTASRTSDGEDKFGAFVNEGALGGGVLRRSVPLWLHEPDLRPLVVGHTTAHIRHGGEGALYVQLRRRR